MLPQRKLIDPKDACVLLVEDNLQNTLLISRILDHMGVQQYEWRPSGWQLIQAAEKMPRLDLVLLDLHLPYEDGFEVLAKIRNDPRYCQAWVVAVTADVQPETMKRAREAGFDGFIGKPLNLEKFPRQLSDVLQGKAVWDIGD
jgi:two-component system cell cycle response regulator DivK